MVDEIRIKLTIRMQAFKRNIQDKNIVCKQSVVRISCARRLQMGTFIDKVKRNIAAGRYASAGFDPRDAMIPDCLRGDRADVTLADWRNFMTRLIPPSVPHAGQFKLNWAFFLSRGSRGLALLEDLCGVIKQAAPHAVLTIDMKVGDISDSNHGYVNFAFDICGADAITVHPYMGREAMKPFLEDPDKGVFVLCRTSNPSGEEFQGTFKDKDPLFMQVARNVAEFWNTNHNCGLVIGATRPDELTRIRTIAPVIPLLIPGIGKQGGSLRDSVTAAVSQERGALFFLHQSSSFMHASVGEEFAQAAGTALEIANIDVRHLLSRLGRRSIEIPPSEPPPDEISRDW